MTRIRATCPTCGEVELLPGDIELFVVGESLDDVGSGSHYEFSCSSCIGTVSKPADGRIARLLVSGGVEATFSSTGQGVSSPRISHPESPADGPAFTPDDLIDFHLLLSTHDWFDSLLTLTV